MTDQPNSAPAEITAKADIQYLWRVYLFFILVFGFGLYAIRDGFVKWPAENARLEQMKANGQKLDAEPHNQAGILINRALGIVFPSVSLPVFLWLLYRGRGAYRLSGNTLSLPGQEPISLDRIRSMDKSNFDKKGHATIEFDDAGGKPQQFTMRDMVYKRKPTDQIIDRIEQHLKGAPAAAIPPTTSPNL